MAFVINPIASSFVEFHMQTPVAINDSGVVVGTDNLDGGTYRVARWHANTGTEIFTDMKMHGIGDVNFSGEFCALIHDPNNSVGSRGTPCRVGEQLDWVGDLEGANYTSSLNDSGDIIFVNSVTTGKGRNRTTLEKAFFYHATEDKVFSIDSLVEDSILSNGNHLPFFVTNRDISLNMPAPVISGGVEFDEFRLFFLFPEGVSATPGITVSPTSGLKTHEDGSQASFNIVLNTQPVADVTIGISSDKTQEGTVDPSSLTFTSTNWNASQTVTVTGVDDFLEDGDVGYTIVTAAATSSDPDYNGLDADDVSVTNQDDDSPVGGGTEMYSSTDTPTNIPDQGMADSMIVVSDDYQIVDMTVTLNISHPRPSDLTAYLVVLGLIHKMPVTELLI